MPSGDAFTEEHGSSAQAQAQAGEACLSGRREMGDWQLNATPGVSLQAIWGLGRRNR
jgi:hypothetical protein